MKRNLRCLALALASALLFSFLLTGCGGGGNTGGNGGNGGDSGIVTPDEGDTSYEASEDGMQVVETDKNGETVSVTEIEEDELDGGRTLTRTYNITAEQVEEQGCIVAQEIVTTDVAGQVTVVVRKYAIAAGKLVKTNGTVALLAEIVLPDAATNDIIYVVVTSEYENGELVKTTIEYEDEDDSYSVRYNVNAGELEFDETSIDSEDVVTPVLAVIGQSADAKGTLLGVAGEAKKSAETLVTMVDGALEKLEETKPEPEIPAERAYGVPDLKLTLEGEDSSQPEVAVLYVSGEIMEVVTNGRIMTDVTAQAELFYDEETGKLAQAKAEVPKEIVAAFPNMADAVFVADFDCAEEGAVGIMIRVEQDGVLLEEDYRGAISYADGRLTGASLNLGDMGDIIVELEYDGDTVSAVSVELPSGKNIAAELTYAGDELTTVDVTIAYNGKQETINVEIDYEGDAVCGVAIQMPDRGTFGEFQLTHSGGKLVEVTASGVVQGENAEGILTYDANGDFEELCIVADTGEIAVDADKNAAAVYKWKISEEESIIITESAPANGAEHVFMVDGKELTEEELVFNVPAREIALKVDDAGVWYTIDGGEEKYVAWTTWGGHDAELDVDDGIWIYKEIDELGEIQLNVNSGKSIEKNEDGNWTIYTDAHEVHVCKKYEEYYEGDEVWILEYFSDGSGYSGTGLRIGPYTIELYSVTIPRIIKLADLAVPRLSQMLANRFVLN